MPREAKLDSARRLRGIYFIDLGDEEYKETLQKARRKLERPVAVAMPCKRTVQTSITKAEIASQGVPGTGYGSKVESPESTWQRVEPSLPEHHEDHIAGKGYTSMTHYNLVHEFIPVPLAKKIRDAKDSSG